MKLQLSHRLSQYGIKDLCALTQGEHNDNLKEELYQLTFDEDERISTNDRCLKEEDATKLRLMLNLLLRQPYTEEDIRTDFIDYCLMRLTDPKSPYAVRAQCIKLAYEQMRYWPELLN